MRRVITLLLFSLSEAIENSSDIKVAKGYVPQPSSFNEVVPFGHITLEGFGAPGRPPVDLLERQFRYLKKSERDEELKKGVQFPTTRQLKDLAFDQNELKLMESAGKRALPKDGKEENKISRLPFLDFVGIQRRNFNPRRMPSLMDVNPSYQIPSMFAKVAPPDDGNKTAPFPLKTPGKNTLNITTCDEFGKNPDFNPKDVVNIDWVPFFIWAEHFEVKIGANVHVLSFPTEKLVQVYKQEMGPFLDKKMDWKRPKLLLKERGRERMEMLLISINRKGYFYGIPYNELPKPLKMTSIQLPVMKLRFKIVDPYLAMMICDIPYATIMAASGTEPTEINDIITQAAILNFTGPGTPVIRNLEEERLVDFMEREERARIAKERLQVDRKRVTDNAGN